MRCVFVAMAFAGLCGTALAEPKCTTEPREKWISESEMKAKISSLGYQTKIFKITKGNCYELYGLDKSGRRIEIYFDPITGKIVQEYKS